MIEPNQPLPRRRLSPMQLLIPGVGLGLLMIGIALIVTGLVRGEPTFSVWYPSQDLDYLMQEIALGIVSGTVFAGVIWQFGDYLPAMQRIRALLTNTLDFRQMTLPQAIALGLVAGFPEEILFRGSIQPIVGLLIAALIFGILHFITAWYMVYALVAGLLLGLLFEWRGDLWASTAAHACYDTLIFLLMADWVRHQDLDSRDWDVG